MEYHGQEYSEFGLARLSEPSVNAHIVTETKFILKQHNTGMPIAPHTLDIIWGIFSIHYW
jgi:hypothetical protein